MNTYRASIISYLHSQDEQAGDPDQCKGIGWHCGCIQANNQSGCLIWWYSDILVGSLLCMCLQFGAVVTYTTFCTCLQFCSCFCGFLIFFKSNRSCDVIFLCLKVLLVAAISLGSMRQDICLLLDWIAEKISTNYVFFFYWGVTLSFSTFPLCWEMG